MATTCYQRQVTTPKLLSYAYNMQQPTTLPFPWSRPIAIAAAGYNCIPGSTSTSVGLCAPIAIVIGA